MKYLPYVILSLLCAAATYAAEPPSIAVEKAPAPLFDDPIWHGAADPTVIWNSQRSEWVMYYTQRRATLHPPEGVRWCHGSAIGIATSKDGLQWSYLGICDGDDGLGKPIENNCTWWAPSVYREDGDYHLFVVCVEGIPTNWSGKAAIKHFTSRDGVTWKFQSRLALSSDRCIDACVAKIGGQYYLWYKDERHGSHTWMAASPDLNHWKVVGESIGGRGHEAPLVWPWRGRYWMIVDGWKGLSVYSSADGLKDWTLNSIVLSQPGTREKDNSRGGHPFVMTQGDRALLFYHVHYGPNDPAYAERRTVIQMTTLDLDPSGKVVTDRDRAIAQARLPWGDQGDGTFKNPILPADFSDLDAIRVGSDYYAISSTMQYSPGMVVLQSKDLVNWRILSHVVDDLTQISPDLNWDRMNRGGRGIWAGAIRHHADRFWVYFGTPDEGYFVSTAANPAGPWTPPSQVMKASGWDDCCPFWDDDGQGYLVGSDFKNGYKIHLFKLTPDGKGLVENFDHVIHQSKGSEANKLYKWNGLYYHFFSEVKPEGRVVMMGRSKSITGPYEVRQLNHVDPRKDREPNQGGIVQTEKGDWWFLTHQGSGRYDGRPMCLLPVTWRDGWPIVGGVGPDGIGTMLWQANKPIVGFPITRPQMSDQFDSETLQPQWEWHYQPRREKWSLADRPGRLRLHAFKPIQPGNLLKAGNTLTQRLMGTDGGEVTIKLDVSHLSDGQAAGLCHFGRRYAWIGVTQDKGLRRITYSANGRQTLGPAVTSADLWLRSIISAAADTMWAYSFDGKQFASFGEKYPFEWADYRGDRIGIFNYNNDSDSGYVDIDWFHYSLPEIPQKQP